MPMSTKDSRLMHPWNSPWDDISVQSGLEKRPPALLRYGRQLLW